MSEIDERLAEIRARVDGATPDDLGFIDGYAQPAMLANARADLGYLLDLVAGLRAINADVILACQKWERVAEVRFVRIEVLRQQLDTQAAEASSACQEWDAKYQELERRLAEAEVLVPDTELMKRAAGMMWHNCESCPTLNAKCPGWPRRDRAKGICSTLAKELRDLATRIRAWREPRRATIEETDGYCAPSEDSPLTGDAWIVGIWTCIRGGDGDGDDDGCEEEVEG